MDKKKEIIFLEKKIQQLEEQKKLLIEGCGKLENKILKLMKP